MVGITGFDVYLSQIFVPALMCSGFHTIEVPFGYLAEHIVLGAIDVDCRYAHFGIYHFTFFGAGKLKQCLAAWLLLVANGYGVVYYGVSKRLRELGVEIDILVECPKFGHLMAHNFGVADYFELHTYVHLVIKRVVEVYYHAGIFSLWECPAVNGAAGGRGDFGLDTVAVEHH